MPVTDQVFNYDVTMLLVPRREDSESEKPSEDSGGSARHPPCKKIRSDDFIIIPDSDDEQ